MSLSTAQIKMVETIVLEETEEERLLFSHSPNGKFKVKEYLKQRRSPCSNIPWTEIIWNPYTSKRVNAFMWMLFLEALPVDERIQARGISLVSKCCCVIPERETLHHLFIQSELAKETWSHFKACTRFQFTGSTIQSLVFTWFGSSSMRSQLGVMILGSIFYGFWDIWKERCRIRYEDGARNQPQLIHKIFAHIYALNLKVAPKRAATT